MTYKARGASVRMWWEGRSGAEDVRRGAMRVSITVNGLDIEASYRDEDIEGVFKPLVRHWSAAQRRLGGRYIVFMSAPPGSGKTTLSLCLAQLSHDMDGCVPIQAIGMDGYHYPNAYLDSHTYVEDSETITLRSRKGASFTYDVAGLRAKLADARGEHPTPWPEYSRVLHDAVPDAMEITGDILLVEGNYFQIGEGAWAGIGELADETVYISAPMGLLRDRLVGRKLKGGSTQEEAEAWFERSDDKNVRRVLGGHVPADIELALGEDGGYTLTKGTELLVGDPHYERGAKGQRGHPLRPASPWSQLSDSN